MKKLFVILFLSIMCIIPCGVNAQSMSYRTYSGVVVDKALYDKMCEIYSTNYVETLTEEEFYNLANNDLDNVIKVEYVEEENTTRGSYFSSPAKAIEIIKNGNWVTLMAAWLTVPTIHSFDVMAVRLSGCILDGDFSFKQTYVSSGHMYVVRNGMNQYFSNGFGASALLQYGTDNEYTMTFAVLGSGTVYGTYQHAIRSVSSADSLNYTIASNGYGKVAKFASNVSLNYDGMNGVDISF